MDHPVALDLAQNHAHYAIHQPRDDKYSNFENTFQVESAHVCTNINYNGEGLTRMKSSTCMEGGRLVFCFLERNRFDRPDLIRISMATKTQHHIR